MVYADLCDQQSKEKCRVKCYRSQKNDMVINNPKLLFKPVFSA